MIMEVLDKEEKVVEEEEMIIHIITIEETIFHHTAMAMPRILQEVGKITIVNLRSLHLVTVGIFLLIDPPEIEVHRYHVGGHFKQTHQILAHQ